MKSNAKNIAALGLCTALALILSYVEFLLPPLFPAIPGIKMGLANIIVLFLLYRRGGVSAAIVSLLRVVLVSILFGNLMMLWYSLGGAILSLGVMLFLKRPDLFSAVGISIAGAVSHNVGQVLVAILLLGTTEIGYYMSVLLVTGTVAGIFIGLCGALLIKKIPKNMF